MIILFQWCFIIYFVSSKDIPIVSIKNKSSIFLPGQYAELECDAPRDAIAVSWYQGSRILGTFKLSSQKGKNIDGLTPYDLNWEVDSEDLISYDPKMEFNRLRSYSAGDHRRARSYEHSSDRAQSDTDSLPDFDQYWRRLNLSNGRKRRSISETEAQLMNLSSVKSIGPFQETGNFKFNRKKMIIRAVDVSHEGNMICVAKLDKYRAIASEPFRLQIAKMADLSPPSTEVVEVHINSTAILTCKAPISIPEAKISWFKWVNNDRIEIQNSDRYFIDGKLSIFGVQEADEGHFTCQATNKLLKKSIHLPIAIELKVLPNEIQNAAWTKIITYRAGVDRPVILPGCGSHSSWSYSSKLVDVQFRKDAAIANPSPSNRKLIEVICSNNFNNVTIRYTLRPKYAPVFLGSNYKAVTINGDNSSLRCPPFKSYPKSTITWKHNGRDISDASDNIMVKDDRLVINKPTKYSRGYYQCYVENEEGIAYGLVNVNIKPKMTRNQVPANQNKSENRLKIKSSTCVQRGDGDFEIRFEWKTKQISIDGFIYRVEFENTKARSNPLYSPPMIEEEYMVSANQRSEKKIVSKPGEYKISIRYKDGYADFSRGISKEDVDVVHCRNRPRPPCREVRKFPYRIPEVTNVTSSFLHLDGTGEDTILLEWDVTFHFKDPSINDHFEIEVQTGSNHFSSDWIKYSNKKLKRIWKLNEAEGHQKLGHFQYPYRIKEFHEDTFRYRLRRVWSKTCYKKKTSQWRYSKKFSISHLKISSPSMMFHLQQIDSKSVLFDIVSNTAAIGSLNVCWKAEYPEVVMMQARCRKIDGLDIYLDSNIRLRIDNLYPNLWVFTFENQAGEKFTKSLKTTEFLEPSYMSTKRMIPADYVIDIMDGLPGAPCDNNDRINSLSFMQGSVIGILIVFILLCITIIVILLRKRKEKASANQQEAVLVEDKPPQYSREDHRIYHNNNDSLLQPKQINLPKEEPVYLQPAQSDKHESSSSCSLMTPNGYDSQSTLPYVENT